MRIVWRSRRESEIFLKYCSMDKQSLTHKTHIIANNTGLPFNTVLTHYFLEIILSRIAASDGSKHFIFKGGFLLSNILGINTRTMADIDFSIVGIGMTEMKISALINQALQFVGIRPVTQCGGHCAPSDQELAKKLSVHSNTADRGHDDGRNHFYLEHHHFKSVICVKGVRIKKKDANAEGTLRKGDLVGPDPNTPLAGGTKRAL